MTHLECQWIRNKHYHAWALSSAEIEIEIYRKVHVLPKYGIQGLTFQAKAPASSLTLRDNKTPNTNLYKQRRRSNVWVNSHLKHLFTKTFKQGSNMGITLKILSSALIENSMNGTCTLSMYIISIIRCVESTMHRILFCKQ